MQGLRSLNATRAQCRFCHASDVHVMELIHQRFRAFGRKVHLGGSFNAFVVNYANHARLNCLAGIGCVSSVQLQLPLMKMCGVMKFDILHIYKPRARNPCIVCQCRHYLYFNLQMHMMLKLPLGNEELRKHTNATKDKEVKRQYSVLRL
jgi:hypothetical protein